MRRLEALRFETTGSVSALVSTPQPDDHCFVHSLRVLPEVGVEGQYPGKQWWQGRRVPGRQISALNTEVLDTLDIGWDVPGDNLIVSGIALASFAPGDVLRVGEAFLQVTGTPHRPCAKFAQRTSLAKMHAISHGKFRGILLDALRPATVYVGDTVERLLVTDPTVCRQR